MKISKKFYYYVYILVKVSLVLSILSVIGLIFTPYFFPSASNLFSRITISVFSFDILDFNLSIIMVILLIIQSLVIIFLLFQLHTFFKNLSKNQIFVMSNAKAIINSGYTLSFMSIFINIPPLVLASEITPYISFSEGEYSVKYQINLELLIAAIAVIVLGIVFKKAVKIAQENELTI